MRFKQHQPLTPSTPPAPTSQLTAAPTLTLFPAQVAAVASYLLANPELANAYGLAPAYNPAPAPLGEPVPDKPETRTYHLGTKPTPDRGYDDRLTVCLGISRSTIMKELNLWRDFAGRRGGLRHVCAGKKYVVSELAVREWLGDRAI